MKTKKLAPIHPGEILREDFMKPHGLPFWKQVLRWIAVLPGAFLAALVLGFLTNLLLMGGAAFAVGSAHPDEQSWLLYVLRGIAVSVICSVSFVWCGATIAPCRKTAVAIGLAVLVCALAGYGGFLCIAEHRWTALSVCPFLAGAAIYAAGMVAKKEVTV